MRIVLLNQYYAPAEAATAQFLSDLGEHLVGAGHQVTAVCSRRAYRDPSRLFPAEESLAGVRVRRTWTTGFGRSSGLGRMVDYLAFLVGAARILATEREVDVVLSLTTPPLVASLGLAAARLRGGRSACWVMDIYPELAFRLGVLGRRSVVGRLLEAVGRFTLSRSDASIALGETMASLLREAGAPNVHVVHNWADGEAIRTRSTAEHRLRREWGWQERFVVLYSGNLGLVHEFDTVLDAAERLAGDDRVLFAFVGDGPRLDAVSREVARRRLSNVEFRPHVAREALGESLTAGDVHLVTLREGAEGLVVPSKIYGILAAGRPTLYVGPERGEVAELLAAGRCGARVAVGDAAGLVRAIRGYAGDESRREEHGRRARRLFEERFTKERSLAAHRRVLELLADDSS